MLSVDCGEAVCSLTRSTFAKKGLTLGKRGKERIAKSNNTEIAPCTAIIFHRRVDMNFINWAPKDVHTNVLGRKLNEQREKEKWSKEQRSVDEQLGGILEKCGVMIKEKEGALIGRKSYELGRNDFFLLYGSGKKGSVSLSLFSVSLSNALSRTYLFSSFLFSPRLFFLI